ncbi:TadE/TadG family type IV pilus assembly protein (plasmid) [Isosphaeraceae bacterium EP7]
MLASRNCRRRRGAAMLEAALVLPVLFMLIFGLVVVGMAVSCHQQVTLLAREGARYASVHGAGHAKDTGGAEATEETVYSQAILPKAVGLDPGQITSTVTWDHSSKSPIYQPTGSSTLYRINYVTVVVSYKWRAPSFPGSAARTITLTSTSRMPLCN